MGKKLLRSVPNLYLHTYLPLRIGSTCLAVSCLFLFLSLNLYNSIITTTAARTTSFLIAPMLGTPSPACTPTWNVVSSPDPSSTVNRLFDVVAASANDVWVVGVYDDAYNIGKTLIEHWDGNQWNLIPSPNPAAQNALLSGVTAVSANDAWAVGYYQASGPEQTLIEHWDGTQWSVVPSPNVDGRGILRNTTTVSASDIWAVGYYTNNSGVSQTLIEHWDGSQWSVVPSPNNGPSDNWLRSVSAVSPSDIWTVGIYHHIGFANQTLTEHWNGMQWSVVPSPNVGTYTASDLNGVAAISANDAWAVGDSTDGLLIEHWDGTQWSIVASPNPGDYRVLYSVSATSANDVWAVGYYFYNNGIDSTLILHWDGTSWSQVPSPSPGTFVNSLQGVVAISANDVWAAGYFKDSDGPWQTLIEHYALPSGQCLTPSSTPYLSPSPTITPSASATPILTIIPTTTGTDTDTPVVPTTTATSTATSTAINTTTSTATLTPPPCGTAWRQDPNSIAGGILNDVAALNATDIWAVGVQDSQTLTEHWDGTSWTVIPSPNVGTNPSLLRAVAVVATNDAWAVGYSYEGSNTYTLTEHWDGSQWYIVPSFNPGENTNRLWGVAAVSANDVWAVGLYFAPVGRALAEHWDGNIWTVVSTPQLNSPLFWGVTAIASDDVWAVGEYIQGKEDHALIEHWDGESWSIVPDAAMIGTSLYGVAAVTTDDVWAVGYTGFGTITEHWDGMQWNVVPSPNLGTYNMFQGVDAASSTDIWAVGWYLESGFTSMFLAHWDGGQWTEAPGPDLGAQENELFGVAMFPSGEAWAVGVAGSSLIVHYSDPCITPSVTPSPSNTATITPTVPPTSTPSMPPTSTPIVCTIEFTDVPVGSTFHDNILCLACQGLINGYPCGGPGEPCDGNNDPYFRPGNNVTRGQLSKIVSNAAGFSDPQTTQMFEDVSPASTFFDFIGRLASRGLINGYPCGNPEPCGPSNLPYFRPANTATRGQIAKIDVLGAVQALGWTLSNPATNTFEDVGVGSTFYQYIETAYAHNVLDGYPCGGAGEPCGPGNKPYFRPNNNASRGQISKIVSSTFFPNCAFSQGR